MRLALARVLMLSLIGVTLLAAPVEAIQGAKGTQADQKHLERWTTLALSVRDEAKKVLPELKDGTADTGTLTARWARLNEETLILVERIESAELREIVKEMGLTLRNWHGEFAAQKEARGQFEIAERLADYLTERTKK
jgi:hypothetical protein